MSPQKPPKNSSPWGPAYIDMPYVAVPHSIWLGLNMMKPPFESAEKIVVVSFVSFIYSSSPYLHQISLAALAERAAVGISTVQRTIKKMKANGLRVVETYDFQKNKSTIYDSTAFFKKLGVFAVIKYEEMNFNE